MKLLRRIPILCLVLFLLAGCLWEPTSEGTATSPVTLSQYDVYQGSVGRLSNSYYEVATLSGPTGIFLENGQSNPLDLKLSFFATIGDIDSRDPIDATLVLSAEILSYMDYSFFVTLPNTFYLRIDSLAPVVGQKYSITVY